ncbi:MAG: hypothetical protein ACRDGA_12075 [Bacteroidota bacterium]
MLSQPASSASVLNSLTTCWTRRKGHNSSPSRSMTIRSTRTSCLIRLRLTKPHRRQILCCPLLWGFL